MGKALRDKSEEELREETSDALSNLLSALLRGAQRTHTAHGMSQLTRAKYSAALDGALEEVGDQLQRASECLRKAQSAWTVIGDRARKEKG